MSWREQMRSDIAEMRKGIAPCDPISRADRPTPQYSFQRRSHSDDWMHMFLGAMLVVIVAVGCYALYDEFVLWPEYKATHECYYTGYWREHWGSCGKTSCIIREYEYNCKTIRA